MLEMKDILPPNLFTMLDRVGVCTPRQILLLSEWDIKKLTKLNDDDIKLLKSIVSECICPLIISGKEITKGSSKICTGCSNIDILINGGFRRGTITEIYGESGTGKTQLAIQTVAHNSSSGSVYICTEDLFPVKRLNQISKNINKELNSDCGKRIFVEHITESFDLLSCIKVRLPKLLSEQNISLIVLDSIAAPFRCETKSYVQRADELRELALVLLKLAIKYDLCVICINQVTSSFNNSDTVLPSLGLAWSNMVPYRFYIRRNEIAYMNKNIIRELHVIHAPDLPNKKIEFVITSEGIKNVSLS